MPRAVPPYKSPVAKGPVDAGGGPAPGEHARAARARKLVRESGVCGNSVAGRLPGEMEGAADQIRVQRRVDVRRAAAGLCAAGETRVFVEVDQPRAADEAAEHRQRLRLRFVPENQENETNLLVRAETGQMADLHQQE